MSGESAGRRLSELRVCDLKEELEKRKLEVIGNKNTLVERLQKALRDEGHNPDIFLFGILEKRSTSGRKSSSNISNASIMSKVKLDIEIKEEPEDELPIIEIEDDSGMVVDEVGTIDNEEFEEQVDNQNNDLSANDNDESLNLTIEEDEQKLLHAEAQDDKEKKKTDEEGKVEDEEGDVEADADGEGDADRNGDKEKAEDSNAKDEEDTTKGDEQKDNNSINDDKNKKVDSEQTSPAKSTTAKDEKDKSSPGTKSKSSSSRNLWVSGLSSITRASDLKTIFSKYGKVMGAKVVTNTRTPGSRCYGYVTMASSSDASRCIEHLHRTELHGRIISVERTKNEIGSNTSASIKRDTKTSEFRDHRLKSEDKDNKEKSSKDKKTENNDTAKKIDSRNSGSGGGNGNGAVSTITCGNTSSNSGINDKAKSVTSSHRDSRKRSHSSERKRRDKSKERERERERRREREVLSFQKIREERERQRLREKERQLREEERRRRDIRRRQREEEKRLAMEREKLQIERERLEREKAELLRLERERQKLEREKIELERLELKRQQIKLMQSSRIEETKRPLKRSSNERYSEPDRKRTTTERRFEPPPPPRFDSSIASRSSDKKRDEYNSSKRDDYKRDIDVPRHSSNYHTNRSETNHKTGRYTEPERPDPRSSSFRRGDDRGDLRNSNSKRYEVSSYAERQTGSSGSQWHNHSSGPPTIKSFTSNTMQSSNSIPSWQSKSSDDHWRPVDSSQDRYDRTYNERSGPYMESSRQGLFVGRPQDRYSGQISRYENGKY